MDNSGTGFLKIRVSTARDALPLGGASVRISPYGDGENGVMYSLTTNISGETETVRLSAPAEYLSTSPGSARPFSSYNIEVTKDGYTSVLNVGTSVFSGVVTTLPVSLVPLAEFGESATTVKDSTSSGGVYAAGVKYGE